MQVKDFEKYRVFRDGSVLGARGEWLRPWIGRGGYKKICLYNDNGEKRWVYIHRLVCETFHSNPLCKKEINHRDGNKLNNHADNVEWVTRSENGLHAHRTGLNVAVRGEKVGSHKLTAADVAYIREMKGTKTLRKLREELGISLQHLWNIQAGRYWKQEVAHV